MSADTGRWGRTRWNGLPAWTASSSGIEAVLCDLGGKIASLRFDGFEWLAQPEPGEMPNVHYGDVFTDGPMCGWDEMFPTITGDRYPDHGEVWSVEWSSRVLRDTLHQSVHGQADDYTLTRIARIRSDGALDLSYSATLRGEADRAFLWAAHPQFVCPDGAMLELHPRPDLVLNVNAPDDPRAFQWPGELVPIESLATDGTGSKYWTVPSAGCSSASILLAGGQGIALQWESAKLPHLGIWVDRGAYAREDVIAIEPSNGFYDDVDRAVQLGHAVVLSPGATIQWGVVVTGVRP